MHELGLAEGVLDVALDAAAGAAIHRVRVRIGERHAVEPESFDFAFHLAAEGTVAADAVLEIEAVPVRLACMDCRDVRSTEAFGPCPVCGGSRVEATGGEELTVAGIELADGTLLAPPDVAAAPAGGH